MKIRININSILPAIILMPFLYLLSGFKGSGCQTDEMISQAMKRLKNYALIEPFSFYIKEKKRNKTAEFTKQVITLNDGVTYKFFTIKNSEYPGNPILSIYNNEKLESLIGTTYNAKFNRFYNEIEFECKNTGNYCLTFSFQDGAEGCALGIFSSRMK